MVGSVKEDNMARNALQNSAYLYVVHEREFIHQQLNVYKVGYTTNIVQRMAQYPKGSRALVVRAVPRSHADVAEAMLLAACRKSQHLKQRRDVGAEYFEGPFTTINSLINMVGNGCLQGFDEEVGSDTATGSTVTTGNADDDVVMEDIVDAPEQPVAPVEQMVVPAVTVAPDGTQPVQDTAGGAHTQAQQDETILIMQYVDERLQDLCSAAVISSEFFQDLSAYVSPHMRRGAVLKYEKVVRVLKKRGVTEVVKTIDGRQQVVLQFPKLLVYDDGVQEVHELPEAPSSYSVIREWLASNTAVTKNNKDTLVMGDLFEVYLGTNDSLLGVDKREFRALAINYFKSAGVVVRDRSSISNGYDKGRSARHVVVGAKLAVDLLMSHLTDWLTAHVHISAGRFDTIPIKELYSEYMAGCGGSLNCSKHVFDMCVQQWCEKNGVTYKASHDIKLPDGKYVTTRKVLVGARAHCQLSGT